MYTEHDALNKNITHLFFNYIKKIKCIYQLQSYNNFKTVNTHGFRTYKKKHAVAGGNNSRKKLC